MMNRGNRAVRLSSLLRRWSLATVALLSLSLGVATAAMSASPGYLGVSLQELTSTLRAGLGVKARGGVLIGDVTDNSPADRAGLQDGDVVLAAGGTRVSSASELQRIVRDAGAGGSLTLHVLRDGADKDVVATLGERPADDQAPMGMQFPSRGTHDSRPGAAPRVRTFRGPAEASDGGFLGVQLADLTPQMRAYFGVGEDEGVMVAQVEKESPAAAAGMQAGDVLVKVGDESVNTQASARQEIRQRKPGSTVSFSIVRNKLRRVVTATLATAPPSDMTMGEMPGMPGTPGMPDMPDMSGMPGMDSPRDLEGLHRSGSGSGSGDNGPGDDDDADAPNLSRSKDGEMHRIIIREKPGERGDVWGDEGADSRDGDKHVRVIVKKRYADGRDSRHDRELRREIRDLRKQIEELRDQLRDENRGDRDDSDDTNR